MRISRSSARRRGANTVEFAVAAGVAFFLIISLIVGAMGIFRYQEVAHLAREGARYAATHGGKYQLDGIAKSTGVPQVISSSDVSAHLLPRSRLLDPSLLTVTASWSAPTTPNNMPTYADPDPTKVPPGQAVRNYVTVTVTYQWVPEAYLVGPITLTSTSTIPMSY